METILKLIPRDPQFVPDLPARQNAKDLLASFMKADDILVIVTDDIEFVDPGEDLKEIRCPFCDAAIHEDWWLPAMQTASENSFNDLSVTLPCCGGACSLNELRYKESAGFARFILEAINPEHTLTQEQLDLLEKTANCELKMIIAHY